METLSNRSAIEEHQVKRLHQMLHEVLKTNEFYRTKLSSDGFPEIDSLKKLKQLSFTTKTELVQDQIARPPFGSDLTFSLEKYIRIHQTSGTTGKPMYWLDTEESWEWWAECWKTIFQAAGAHAGDRMYFAFSFGPFIGFWAGWGGAGKLGALAMSGGGESTSQRLKAVIEYKATVVGC